MQSSTPLPGLLSPISNLPSELLIEILSFLPLSSILQLAATGKDFASISMSDDVLATLLREILVSGGLMMDDDAVRSAMQQAGSAYDQLSFISPIIKHVGFFLSSKPRKYCTSKLSSCHRADSSPTVDTSRVIRVKLSYERSNNLDQPFDLTLSASQLVVSNDLSDPQYEGSIELPFNCILNPDRTSYFVPSEANTPDAGLSVDLLEPSYQYTPMFSLTSRSGRLGGSSSPNTGLQMKLLETQRVVLDLNESDHITAHERARRDAEAVVSLFTGRRAKRPFPTQNLLAVMKSGEVGRRKGAMRPALALPREEKKNEIYESRVVFDEDKGKDVKEEFVRGWSLRLTRTFPATTLPGSFPPPLLSSTPTIPRNGGPAVMFQNMDADPRTERDRVSLLQSLGSGLIRVVKLTVIDDHERTSYFSSMIKAQKKRFLSETVSTRFSLLNSPILTISPTDEQFYPIIHPSPLISISDPPTIIGENDEIEASSLEGLWACSYGPHGMEVVQLAIKLTRIEGDTGLGDELVSFSSPSTAPSSSLSLPSGRYKRTLEAVKVTGDQNVPSGEFTFIGALSEIDIDVAGELNLGTVPSVRNEDLIRWSYPGAVGADWSKGVVAGSGRGAFCCDSSLSASI
jgi:hypothetical protein